MSAYGYSLLAALVWGIAPLLEKIGLVRMDPVAGVAVRSVGVLVGTLLLLPAVPNLRSQLKVMGGWSIFYLALAGFLASVVGQVFAYNAIKKAEVSQVSPVLGSWPLFVLVFGWLFLQEAMTLQKVLGSALVVAGVWLLRF